MTEVFLSASAQRKMQARGVSFEEIEWAALHPDLRWSNKSLSGQIFEIRSCGDIAVVVKHLGEDLQVMSVLWRSAEQWTDGDMFIHRVVYAEPKVEHVTPVRKRKNGRRSR